MMLKNHGKIVNKTSFIAFAIELVFILAIPMIILSFLGHIIDKVTDSSFFFLIIFTIIGIIISSIITVKKVTSIIDKINEDYEYSQKERETNKKI